MHGLKKLSLAVVLAALLPVNAFCNDDDGTFTITIQGPEVEQSAPAATSQSTVRPRTATQRRANVATRTPARADATVTRAPSAVAQSTVATPSANTTTATTQRTATNVAASAQTTSTSTTAATATQTAAPASRTYSVRSGDTIWSVAHRLMPSDRSINEFQIVASLYRNNPSAFAGGNVNNLLRTTLNVPDDSVIARETVQTGSALLKQGHMTLPPLADAPKAQTAAAATADTAAQNSQTAANQAAKSADAATDSSRKTETQKEEENLPTYEATETKIKRLQEEEAKREQNQLIPNDDSKFSPDSKDKKVDLISKEGQANVNVDVQAVRIMLDENKKSVDDKIRFLEKQLNEALERMKKSSTATAKIATDSVSGLASQYDNIIAKIQQDIIELKGANVKLAQDNDRMREMLLANDEKIEDMQLQLSQFSIIVPESAVDLNKPVMMILFGAGLLSLVMLLLFILFKAKSRAASRVLNDDFDIDDDIGNDDSVLLSDENGSVEIETNSENTDAQDKTEKDTQTKTENSGTDNSVEETKIDPQAEDIKAEDSNDDNLTAEEKEAQDAWDNAATTAAADEEKKEDKSAVLDEWSQALDEQEKKDNTSVEVKKEDEDSVADAWASALNEQEKGEQKVDTDASQEDMADAWAAALNEQENAEEAEEPKETAPSKEQEDMADAWAAALNEQENVEKAEEPKETAPSKEQEDMADAWAAALNEQNNEEAQSPKAEEPEVVSPAVEEPQESSEQEEAMAKAMQSASSDVEVQDTAQTKPADSDVLVEDVDPDTLLNEMSDSTQELLKDVEVKDSAPLIDDSDEIILKTDDTAESQSEKEALEQLERENEAKTNAVLSDEEKSFMEALSSEKNKATEESDESIGDYAEFENDSEQNKEQENSNNEIETLEAEPIELQDKKSTNVDEVVNDDLNLEELLSENTQDNEADAQSDANAEDLPDMTSSLDEAQIPSDDEIAESETSDLQNEESAEVAGEQNLQTADSEIETADAEQEKQSSNVDEVINDDLNLEDLLSEETTERESGEQSESQAEDFSEDSASENAEENATDALDTDEVSDDIAKSETDESVNAADNNEIYVEEIAKKAAQTVEPSVDSTDTDDKVVSWAVPEDDFDVVESNKEDAPELTDAESQAPATDEPTEETTEADLLDLEARLSSSSSQYDPNSDDDIMNMLSSGERETVSHMAQQEDEHTQNIANMLNDDEDTSRLESAVQKEKTPDEEQKEVLEKVFDKIGPISAIDEEPETDFEIPSDNSYGDLTPKEHQYYVDELNLARLYFETGDTEEAIKIIDDVKEHGSDDLKIEAANIMQTYGN
ncbi:MAG: hypothetical protein GX278_05715 [Aeromonadales bacterium]|nr:hypothetical protein [Aeromonadales bacterium]